MLFTATGFLTFCRWKPVLPHPSVKLQVTVATQQQTSEIQLSAEQTNCSDYCRLSNIWLHSQPKRNKPKDNWVSMVRVMLRIFLAVIYTAGSETKMIPICYLTWHASNIILIHVCVWRTTGGKCVCECMWLYEVACREMNCQSFIGLCVCLCLCKCLSVGLLGVCQ